MMISKENFQGTGTALVTPFRQDLSVDEDALARLVEFQIEGGVDMILPCGTTGEGATLESDEWERVIAGVVELVAGRVLVIAGAGCNSTARAQRLTQRAAKLGADAVLSVGPYYNKPTQEGYFEHFKAVTEVNDLPVVVYNVPGRVEISTLRPLCAWLSCPASWPLKRPPGISRRSWRSSAAERKAFGCFPATIH